MPCWLTRPRAIIAINQPEYVEEQSDPDKSQQKEHTSRSLARSRAARFARPNSRACAQAMFLLPPPERPGELARRLCSYRLQYW